MAKDVIKSESEDIERCNAIIRGINGANNDNALTPSETDVHRERLRSYVSNVTVKALTEIGALREELSDLIRSVHEHQETLLDQIDRFGLLGNSLHEMKSIMSDAVQQTNAQFKTLSIVTPLPNSTNGSGTH
jgi:hypothetical protein